MNAGSKQDGVRLVCDLVYAGLKDKARTIIAIAGPPASGKSALAETVVQKINRESDAALPEVALLPMDGYHLDNHILDSRGLLARKGAPETFDAYGFCEAVKRLSLSQEELFFPRFDRQMDLAVANSIAIHPETQVILVEGNYLLLKSHPWSSLRDVFTHTIFLCPPLDVLQERLIQRWITHGLDPDAAKQRATGNDLPNAELVLRESRDADFVLRQVSYG